MIIKIVGKNVEVTEGIKTKIEEKLQKLDKYDYLKADTVCYVVIRTVKEEQIIEVTIPVKNKKIIRAEKRAESLYIAIDLVEMTLTRKIRKEKEKMLDKKRGHEVAFSKPELDNFNPTIVKEKIILLSPRIRYFKVLFHNTYKLCVVK